MAPTLRYPTTGIVPHGAYHLLKGDQPHVVLRSYDDSTVFNLAGPLSHIDRTAPESVQLRSLKGLVGPWHTIDQKGATQDGTTFVDALYDPIEIELGVMARGRSPQHMRTVVRDLIASLDVKQQSELSWFTPEMGRWWTAVRWLKNPVDPIRGHQNKAQPFTLVLRADSGFWESYPHVSQFRFGYATSSDTFDFTTESGLGTDWTVEYTGGGTGVVYADGSQVVSTLANGRTAVCRRNSFTTSTDNQVVEIQIGRFPLWYWATNTYVDLWTRMADSGTAGDDGVRLRIGHRTLRLSYFDSGVETVLRQQYMLIPVRPTERYTLIAGFEGAARTFKVLRNGALAMTVREGASGSLIGSGYRAAGFGMHADGSAQVATIRSWAAGDNSTVNQTGFVERINVGDQPMWDSYTCFGPGLFSFANGPGSTEMITFGPLLAGQVAQIRTDPRKRGVVDLTSTPVTPQDQTLFQKALRDFISFATGNNVPPLLREIESWFGIQPPQGNLYSLLQGRFSDVAAIPAKSPGAAAQTYYVAVGIDDGNADSQIIATGTPLRRLPY